MKSRRVFFVAHLLNSMIWRFGHTKDSTKWRLGPEGMGCRFPDAVQMLEIRINVRLSHPVTVTTRIITFLVGNPYKPSFATVTGLGGRSKS